MIKSPRAEGAKGLFLFLLICLISTDTAILMDIPIWRQVLGFMTFTIIPGLLILHALKLDRVSLTEKVILSVGLSIAFLMFAGLLINWVYYGLGYETPLSTPSLVISFSAILIILAIIARLRNKDSLLHLSDLHLSTKEKAFLVLPAIFPILSILGMDFMNTTDNNVVLMVLLVLIPAYTIFVAFKHRDISPTTYAPMIFLISISLLLMLSLRSSHLIGADVHLTYQLFQSTFAEQHWHMFQNRTYDACLSISLLPAIYQSLLNIDSEYLFKLLFSLLFSVSPLIIYVISRKYIGNFYAFLAAMFFMSQTVFLNTSFNARTNIAILFFGMAIMVLFRKGIDKFRNRLLFVILASSCIVSHYSTSYIFLFVLILAWMIMELVSALTVDRSPPPDKSPPYVTEPGAPMSGFHAPAHSSNAITYTGIAANIARPQLRRSTTAITVLLFFAILFLWYGQITEAPLDAGMEFVHQTLTNFGEFFAAESRGQSMGAAMGQDILHKDIPHKIEFLFSWVSIALIGIGVLSMLLSYRHTISIPGPGLNRPSFMRAKFHTEYFAFALSCSIVLVLSVASPYVLKGYAMDRTYFQMMTVLPPFFIIGGILLAKVLKAKPYLVILTILIPYFMCTTGLAYQMFDFPKHVTLNSEGDKYDYLYVHDQETLAAEWLKDHSHELAVVYSDHFGLARLVSQGDIQSPVYAGSFIERGARLRPGYFYMRYSGVVKGKMMDRNYEWHPLSDYKDEFAKKDRIYVNSGSELWV